MRVSLNLSVQSVRRDSTRRPTSQDISILNSHSDSRPHWCPNCGKQFLYQQDVGKHLDYCGVETKGFECTLGECKGKKFFTTEQQLRNHKIFHKLGDPFVCQHCRYTTFY